MITMLPIKYIYNSRSSKSKMLQEEIISESFKRLFPNENNGYEARIKYSGKLKPYNANVRKAGNKLIFSLSREWQKTGNEIKIGLIQDLLLKISGKKGRTANTELYDSFIKNLHMATAKTEQEEKLLALFNAVNEKYFNNSLEAPNLRWGMQSKARLATYDYHTDTITVSSIFREAEESVISYLLYHEMLHKKLKFSSGNGRTIHHSIQFRELEKQFENHPHMEEKLRKHASRHRRMGWLRNIL